MGDAIRLLFVLNAPITGGAERHTFDLAAALSAEGFAPALFAMRAGPLAPPAAVPLLAPAGPRGLPARVLDLARRLRAEPPGAIVAVNERPVAAALAASRLAGARTPLVAVLHSTLPRSRREAGVQRLTARLLGRADATVLLAGRQRAHWRALGLDPRREAVIPNGVDLARFAPRPHDRDRARAAFGLAPGDLALGMSAVLRPEKNHVALVEAVARLRAEGFPARALLLGDGPERGRIAERARALGVEAHVILAGARADVAPCLPAFDVGVLCSTAIETLSLAALEIMACGVPMAMSDIGGADEIVDGDNGRLFPPGDVGALCGAVRALADPGVRAGAGRAARATVEARFDHRTMTARYAALLREVAAAPR